MKIIFQKTIGTKDRIYKKGEILDSKEVPNYTNYLKSKVCKRYQPKGVGT